MQEQYKDQVIVLMGNHEFMLLEAVENKTTAIEDKELLRWLNSLPYFYETNTQIFVHAGIDEEAGEYWKWGSENYYFCCKYPHTVGKFEKDIIAGHIGTDTIAGIGGTTEHSGFIPLLKYNTETKIYTSFEKLTDEAGAVSWHEYGIEGNEFD